MDFQLGFTWGEEGVTWEIPQQPAPTSECMELPQQLGFKIAEHPAIYQEKPQPLQYTRAPPKQRSLVQFDSKALKAKSKAPVRKPTKKKSAPSMPKGTWNTDTKTTGLFDPTITKKVPLNIKLAMKERPSSAKQPNRLQKKKQNPAQSQITNNLDFKFVADQEEMVKKLEKQLQQEKEARKQMDVEFSKRMQEFEKYKKLDKQVEEAKQEYLTKQTKKPTRSASQTKTQPSVLQKPTQKVVTEKPQVLKNPIQKSNSQKPQVLQKPTQKVVSESVPEPTQKVVSEKPNFAPRLKKTEPPKQRFGEPSRFIVEKPNVPDIANRTVQEETIKHDSKGGHIFELPTKDIQPLILQKPAQKSFPAKPLEVTDLNQQMDPFLTTLSSAMTKLQTSQKYGTHPGVGLIARASAKYIAYYADNLSELIADDLIMEFLPELQEIENKQVQTTHKEFHGEAQHFLDEIIKDFQQRAESLQDKYQKYSRPVIQPPETHQEEIVIEDKQRIWKVHLDELSYKQIRNYKKAFEDFQQVYCGSSENKLWEVYGIISEDLLDKAMEEVIDDYQQALEEFAEEVISQEFY